MKLFTRIAACLLVPCLLREPAQALFDVIPVKRGIYPMDSRLRGNDCIAFPLTSQALASQVPSFPPALGRGAKVEEEQIFQQARELLPTVADFTGRDLPKGKRKTMTALRNRFPDVFGSWEASHWRTFWESLLNDPSAFYPRKGQTKRWASILAHRFIVGETLDDVGSGLKITRGRVQQLGAEFFRQLKHTVTVEKSGLKPQDAGYLYQSVAVLEEVSDRTKKVYKNQNILTLKDLTILSEAEFLRFKGAGRKSLNETKTALAARGLFFSRTEPIDARWALSPNDPGFLDQSTAVLEEVSGYAKRAYKSGNIHTLKDLTILSVAEFLRLKGSGRGTLDETRKALAARGLTFALEPPVEWAGSAGVLESAPAAFAGLCRQIALFPVQRTDARFGAYYFTQWDRVELHVRRWAGGPPEYEANFSLGGYNLTWNGWGLHVRYGSLHGFTAIPVLSLDIRSEGPGSIVLRLPPDTVDIFQTRGLPLSGSDIGDHNKLEQWRIETLNTDPPFITPANQNNSAPDAGPADPAAEKGALRKFLKGDEGAINSKGILMGATIIASLIVAFWLGADSTWMGISIIVALAGWGVTEIFRARVWRTKIFPTLKGQGFGFFRFNHEEPKIIDRWWPNRTGYPSVYPSEFKRPEIPITQKQVFIEDMLFLAEGSIQSRELGCEGLRGEISSILPEDVNRVARVMVDNATYKGASGDLEAAAEEALDALMKSNPLSSYETQLKRYLDDPEPKYFDIDTDPVRQMLKQGQLQPATELAFWKAVRRSFEKGIELHDSSSAAVYHDFIARLGRRAQQQEALPGYAQDVAAFLPKLRGYLSPEVYLSWKAELQAIGLTVPEEPAATPQPKSPRWKLPPPVREPGLRGQILLAQDLARFFINSALADLPGPFDLPGNTRTPPITPLKATDAEKWRQKLQKGGHTYERPVPSGQWLGPLTLLASELGFLDNPPRTAGEALFALLIAEPNPMTALRQGGESLGQTRPGRLLLDQPSMLSATQSLYDVLIQAAIRPYTDLEGFKRVYAHTLRWEVLALLVMPGKWNIFSSAGNGAPNRNPTTTPLDQTRREAA